MIVDEPGVFKLLHDERFGEADIAAGGFYKYFGVVYFVVFIIANYFVVLSQAH